MVERIKYLDGFRGLAIILVLLFHTFYHWQSILPYKNYCFLTLFSQYCWLGVMLFFLISGFVILATLDKCNSFWFFIYKRWLRLFPAMLIATLFIISTSRLIPNRPNGLPSFQDLFPGLLFCEPTWLEKIFNTQFHSLDGSFWSLYVEVKFYIIFSLLYFIFGKSKALIGIFSLFILFFICNVFNIIYNNYFSNLIISIVTQFSTQYYGWFTSGTLVYCYYLEGNKKFLWYSIGTGILSSISISLRYLASDCFFVLCGAIGIVCVFVYVNTNSNNFIRNIISSKIFLYFGFISYPLYLIHQNFIIGMIKQLYFLSEKTSIFLLITAVILFTILLSDLIARYIEPFIKIYLKKLLHYN